MKEEVVLSYNCLLFLHSIHYQCHPTYNDSYHFFPREDIEFCGMHPLLVLSNIWGLGKSYPLHFKYLLYH